MPIPDDLTTLESKLVDAASGGGIAGPEPPYHVLAGASWPRELTVRAELLRALLVSGPPTTVSADRPLQLRGARILGAVDLEAATIQRPVRFDGCYFLDAINLSEATTRSVSLVNCQLAGMSADQVEIRGNLGRASTICVGELRLRAARITGDLLLDGAKLYGSGGIALDGLGLFRATSCNRQDPLRGLRNSVPLSRRYWRPKPEWCKTHCTSGSCAIRRSSEGSREHHVRCRL